ncbi:aromatic ring-hydroxylating dioxygenase subunit alpha [Gordonia sp. (in: high G+C Gram-positive bacteria)]|uniref:aromatic ring-hydroxylating oxygenase subunit alpha n=1 Tax=Gordonia sp. (in: high G+C Gram-positive bacteria) TaxID=84139 RepID=UPI002639C8D6|nr:aromatic ring-hydroxylating dioxygenase subunit alpha [Gordonia sp. (in: high G+C Gram-positive bacteria)]
MSAPVQPRPFNPDAARAEMAADPRELAARRQPGMSLEAPFYISPEFFDLDIDAIFAKSWIFVANEAEIPEAGDYVVIDIGRYSVIVARDDDEKVAAYHNVCRHRGARILNDACGSVGRIVCGYHQWTYDMNGSLVFADAQAEDFDKSCFVLRKVQVRSVAGLIFLCISDRTPPDFDEVVATVEPYLAPHRLAEAKVAAQIDLIENGNWKLTMENNRECYHCAGGHPELLESYFPVYGFDLDDIPARLIPARDRYLAAIKDLEDTCDALNLPYAEIEDLDDRPTGFRIMREPLEKAGESFTPDGTAAVKKLMAGFPTARLGRNSMHLQPNFWCHFMADHAITFSAIPIAPDKTLLRTTWLVHPDAVEGVDYDLDELTWAWNATNRQDSTFVERAHRGVLNPAYVPGPYAPSEYQVDAFINWYIQRIREHLAE